MGSLTTVFLRRNQVPRQRLHKNVLSQNFLKNKKYQQIKHYKEKKIPFATIGVKFRTLLLIFCFILLYIFISVLLLLLQTGNGFITNIVIYSITGFFTFFMGYFGWILAKNIAIVMNIKKSRDGF